jgi:type IV fimbrial biogenesis protein FimT
MLRWRSQGFTFIEVMVVITVMAIMASLAAPSFMGLLASNAVSSAGNAFIADARFARGEAQRRGKSITMCRSNAPQVAAPTCSSGDGAAVGGWMEGWIVFLDNDGDGDFDAADNDIVLRVQDQMSNLGDFYAVNAAPLTTPVNNRNRITFDATGRAVGQQGRWIVHAAGTLQGDTNYARTLCMNSVGRVRLLKGEAACS